MSSTKTKPGNRQSKARLKGHGTRARKVAGQPASSAGVIQILAPGGQVEVSETTALTMRTVFTCVNGISQDVAKLPIHLYEDKPDGDRVRAIDHPAYNLLRRCPNPEMDAIVFRQGLIKDALIWRGGYAEIERRGNGRPVALWPLDAGRMRVTRTAGGEKVYEYSDPRKGKIIFSPDDIFHVRGIGDELDGYGTIRLARDELLGVKNATMFGRKAFENGVNTNLAVVHPGELGEAGMSNLRKSIEQTYAGPDNAGKVLILEEDMKVTNLTMNLEDMQFLGLRQWSVADVCGWFRFPAHKAGDTSRLAFSSIEQADKDYYQNSLLWWLSVVEMQAWRKLLMPEEQARYMFEHMFDFLARADMSVRAEVLSKYVTNGIMTRDEARRLDNRNRLDDGVGAEATVQVQVVSLKRALGRGNPPALPANPAPASVAVPAETKSAMRQMVQNLVRVNLPMIEQVWTTICRTEHDKATRAQKAGDFTKWADDFYDRQADFVRSRLFPVAEIISQTVDVVMGLSPGPLGSRTREAIRDLSHGHVQAALAAWQLQPPVAEEAEKWASARASAQCEQAEISLVSSIFQDHFSEKTQ